MDIRQANDLLKLSMPVTYASYMLRFAQSRGLEAQQLLEHTGLDAEVLQQQNARISAWQQAVIVANLLKHSNDPGIAIEIGLRSNLTKAGFIGYGLMSCATLREAIELGRRFLPIQVPFFKLDFSIEQISEQEMAVITVQEVLPLLQLRQFCIENFLVEVSEIFRSLLISQTQPDRYQQLQLYFDYPEPDYFQKYKDRLPQLHFSKDSNQFRFPAKMLDQLIQTANSAMTQLVIQQGETELLRLGLTENVLEQVRALMICQQGQYPDLPSIASQLHVSERTLKRKLAEQGISFTELLEDTRKKDACTLLKDQHLSIQEVAERLGYQDRANFTRAFRRWTGLSPSEFRQAAAH